MNIVSWIWESGTWELGSVDGEGEAGEAFFSLIGRSVRVCACVCVRVCVFEGITRLSIPANASLWLSKWKQVVKPLFYEGETFHACESPGSNVTAIETQSWIKTHFFLMTQCVIVCVPVSADCWQWWQQLSSLWVTRWQHHSSVFGFSLTKNQKYFHYITDQKSPLHSSRNVFMKTSGEI